MLGDEPPLSPPEVFYQRMLAGDPAEEVDRAERLLKEQTLLAYYDEVALKGLKLAQNDLTRGSLESSRIEKIRGSIGELIDELGEHEDRTALQGGTHDSEITAVASGQKHDRRALILESKDAQRPVRCWGEKGAALGAAWCNAGLDQRPGPRAFCGPLRRSDSLQIKGPESTRSLRAPISTVSTK